ncbi:sodium-dependent phosphate transport protein 2C-like [Babylonia areolata]|uniref:sodium-dependent phosphate transport protein 2C-like n=1 Tax=Babylonia areolata TaxID=304850 RepID=UPI003FCF248E
MKDKRECGGFDNSAFVPEKNGYLSQRQAETGNSTHVWLGEAGKAEKSEGKEKTEEKEKTEKEEKKEEDEEEEDPWSLPELKSKETPWAELTRWGRVKRMVWYVARVTLLLGLLYLFICSLDILSSAFRLLGGKAAGEALSNTVLFQNPIAGVMLGVLVTVLVQSSSTSTSIVVSMVSADLLPVHLAIPIIMGTNIGTTVTNTIVAVGQSSDRGDFRRAFAAATVHDMFNWLSVLVFLPIEWATRYLARLTEVITQDIQYNPESTDNPELLKAITNPLTEKIVVLSSSKIRDIALGLDINGSLMTDDEHLFKDWSGSDEAAGGILLGASLLVLCVCLVLIVKTLSSLLQGAIAKVLQKFINSDLPGPVGKHVTGYLAILVGAGLTILVQSSSIFTSAITPLVGMGAIHIDRMYPLTLGSNIGTTVTGILSALASDPVGFKNSFQVALSHLFFNISGILVWYPIPAMRRVPLALAKGMGQTVFRYRWFALVYLVLIYFLLPLAVFGLSLAGWEVLLAVGLPIFLLLVAVVIISLLQDKKPHLLPARLRSWEASGLPEPLRSLAPYDRAIMRLAILCPCCKRKGAVEAQPESETSEEDVEEETGLEHAGFEEEKEDGKPGREGSGKETDLGHREAGHARVTEEEIGQGQAGMEETGQGRVTAKEGGEGGQSGSCLITAL